MLLPVLAFVFGTALIAGGALAAHAAARGCDRPADRGADVTARLRRTAREAAECQALVGVFKRIGDKMPRSPKEMGPLRLRLVQAGYRRHEAVTIFFGIRVLFALALFGFCATPILARPNMLMALGGLGLGYILPGMILARLAKRRAKKIQLSLADALDLLVVSVEAGLGLDQALLRVGAELQFAYPELAEELNLINLELRAGKAAR